MWFVLGLSRLARLSRLRFADGADISFDLYLRPSGWALQLFRKITADAGAPCLKQADVHPLRHLPTRILIR
jgi:hypothetical protein